MPKPKKKKTQHISLGKSKTSIKKNSDEQKKIQEQSMKDKAHKPYTDNKPISLMIPAIDQSKKVKQSKSLSHNKHQYLESPQRKKRKRANQKNLVYSVLKPLLELELLVETFMRTNKFNSNQPYCSELKKMILDKKSGRSISLKNIK